MAQMQSKHNKYANSVLAPNTVTKYHWPRIIGAASVVLALVAGGVSLFSGDDTRESPVQAAAPAMEVPVEKASEVLVSETSDPVSDAVRSDQADKAVKTVAVATAVPAPEQTPAKAVEAKSEKTATKAAEPAVPGRTTVALSLADTPAANAQAVVKLPSAPAAAGIPALKTPDTSLPKELRLPQDDTAAILDLSKADKRITRAQFATGVVDYEPVDRISPNMMLHESGIMRVFFFTELKHLKGATVVHEWQRNGKKVATIRIKPYLATMRASSSKFIDRRMTGDWKVIVKTTSGVKLGEFPFKVSMPSALADSR
ncbi:MAG: DUF2914 domain-containing protein [Hahellaceae bacterium]|nr:DUF2914 domain-containing protein [Hahellaceae bacterium]